MNSSTATDVTMDSSSSSSLASSSSSITATKQYTPDEARTLFQQLIHQHPQLLQQYTNPTPSSVPSSSSTTASTGTSLPTPVGQLPSRRTKNSSSFSSSPPSSSSSSSAYSLATDSSSLHKIQTLLSHAEVSPSQRGFQFSKYRMRYIALHFAYIGKNYYGFASQETGGGDLPDLPKASSSSSSSSASSSEIPSYGSVKAVKRSRTQAISTDTETLLSSTSSSSSSSLPSSSLITIESVLFAALRKACLIEDRDGCGYTRCGRTDRGVSAGGQIISLRVRSKALRYDSPPKAKNDNPDPTTMTTAASTLNHTASFPPYPDYIRNSSSALYDYGNLSSSSSPLPTPSSSSSSLWTRGDHLSNTGDPFPLPVDENDYCFILNNILPSDIKILGWSDIPEDFSARFTATNRTYRYYFIRRDLDLDAMREAGTYLIGKHDYRNVCKIDIQNTQNFVREILSIRIVNAEHQENSTNFPSKGSTPRIPRYLNHHIEEANGCTSAVSPSSSSSFRPTGKLSPLLPLSRFTSTVVPSDRSRDRSTASNPRSLYYIEVVGRAFLWHQIRCIACLLFLVGRGAESPLVVKDLLDITKYPARPSYNMAKEEPLILYHCSFGEEEEEGTVEGNDPALTLSNGTVPTDTMTRNNVVNGRMEDDNENGHGGGGGDNGDEEETTTVADERRYRFLRSYPSLHLQWNHSIPSLRRLTMDIEKEWSVSRIHSELLKSILDRVYSVPVPEAALLPADKHHNGNDAQDKVPWALLLDKYSNVRYRENEAKQTKENRPSSVSLSSVPASSSSTTILPSLPSLGDAEYPIVGLHSTVSSSSSSSYVPLLDRRTGKTVEEKWQNLPETKKSSILLIHPTNAPKLIKEFTKTDTTATVTNHRTHEPNE